MKIPPPNDRLCKKHGRPIRPSMWISRHRNSGCAKCANDFIRSPKAKRRRKKRWQRDWISCKFHSNRRCSRSAFVRLGKRRCGSCNDRNKPSVGGSKRKSSIRRFQKHKFWWNKTSAGRASQRRCRVRYKQKQRMQQALLQPFKRRSIMAMLRMTTGFRYQGGEGR